MSVESKTFYIWSDGGSRSNPGPAAMGVVVQDDAGKVVFSGGRYLGSPITNNQAEYQALKWGLAQALEFGAERVVCRLDSKLVVEQIHGRYKVKDAGLAVQWREVRDLLQKLQLFEVSYVPRAQNAEADRLVNEALDQTTYN